VKIRFTKRAIAQVAGAVDYVAERSPQGADRIRERLAELLALLEGQPEMGRITDEPGVRRITLTPFPYVLDYRVTTKEIIVMRFRHGARA
jgi:toxin ParE1/3/4